MKVRKAVVPAAGFGTRFLPVTRSVPKVLLPILDTPSIHYIVQEAAQAGIEEIIMVISEGQEAISRYFRRMPKLENALRRRGQSEVLQRMEAIPDMATVRYVHQMQPLGLGHAVLMAKEMVEDEPFAVFLPDDLIWSEKPTIGSMIEVFDRVGASVIAVREVPRAQVSSLGIIDPEPAGERLYRVRRMVEKPKPEDAPSNLGIVGRYVLTPQVFDELARGKPGAIGEIQLTDALDTVARSQGAYAYKFPGMHFDVGVPAGLLKASAYMAMKRKDVAPGVREWLRVLAEGRVEG
jgi:UTP--glucose-1-phosphate uridylyltransferase